MRMEGWTAFAKKCRGKLAAIKLKTHSSEQAGTRRGRNWYAPETHQHSTTKPARKGGSLGSVQEQDADSIQTMSQQRLIENSVPDRTRWKSVGL
jgi:hypothetical protein